MNVGDIFKTNNCGDLEVIEYTNSRDILIKFIKTGFVTKTSCGNLRKGEVKDLLLPSVHGVGFVGEGVYKTVSGGKHTREYSIWSSILQRCYSKVSHKRRPTYAGVSVSPKWHNFQVFAEWYCKRYKDGYHIDKDLLIVGNKVYSEDSCVLVPSTINNFVTGCIYFDGILPTGVRYSVTNKKFVAQCSHNGVQKHLGCFDTEDAAHAAWKEYKLWICESLKDEMDSIDIRIHPNVIQMIHGSK